MIYSHDRIRDLVAREMLLNPESGFDSACIAVAAQWHQDVEDVKAICAQPAEAEPQS